MILLIDIGNSHLVYGLSKGYGIDILKRVPLENLQSIENIKEIFSNYFIKKIIFSSVVPKINPLIEEYADFLSVNCKQIKGYQDFPFLMKLETPETIGVDRLLSLYALYDEVKTDLMVIDSGTATTYNIVSKEKEFLGGSIGTGLHMLRHALHEKTAVLPLIDLELTIDTDIELLGNNTEHAIKSGIFWGYVCQVNGMIELYKNKFPDLYIVGTGGVMPYIKKHIKGLDSYDGELLLKGLLKFQ